jgi:predicted signal transduction protein with EAL and GGDEF domain
MAATATLQERTVALNEALMIGAMRQHELTEAAENLNAQLQAEIAARLKTAQELEEKARLLDLANAQLLTELAERRRTEEEMRMKNTELAKAMATVKSLSGLLPICSGCKKIRDDKGYWSQVESYISKHSEATFSHGLCPGCIEKYFPGIDLPPE